MAELETVVLDENSISFYYQNVIKENIRELNETNITGIDAKVIEKIRKILNLSFSAFQSMVRAN